VNLREGRREHATLDDEIASLKARRSNIPAAQIAMRSALCKALGLDEDDMPFAGELIQVREDARDWEGAIERVMHNFGLSLLVPDSHYAEVAAWVDRTHLAGRLVYFRIRPGRRSELPELHRDSLVRRLAIKPDSTFYAWLEREVANRFDYACCETPEQFRRETRALTRFAQLKTPGERHEKDDRHRLDDRSRYVLGWSNAAKLATLESTMRSLEARLAGIAASIAGAQASQTRLRQQLEALAALHEIDEFRELDWHARRPPAGRARAAGSEQRRVPRTQLAAGCRANHADRHRVSDVHP